MFLFADIVTDTDVCLTTQKQGWGISTQLIGKIVLLIIIRHFSNHSRLIRLKYVHMKLLNEAVVNCCQVLGPNHN